MSDSSPTLLDTPPDPPGSRRRTAWLLLPLGAMMAAGLAWGVLLYIRRPHLGPVARGERLANRLGCMACHGPGASGGISNPGADSQEVPAWSGGTAMMWIQNEDEIREWILNGKLKRNEADQAKDTPGPAIHMPAYRDRITDAELNDLVAYYLAVSWYRDPKGDLANKGRDVAFNMGCFGCHGPSGMGRLPNPGSFKGYIPGWDGPDYDDLVTSDQELDGWILDGTSKRLEANPAAKFFMDRQQIHMPAYRSRLSDQQLPALKAYIKAVRDGYLQKN